MKSIHITQGRFNPVHAGHEMVVKHVMNAAKKEGADHKILTTGSHDAKKNPLTPAQKVKHLSRAVKGAKVEAMGKDAPTLLHQMSKLHKAGYTHVTMHVALIVYTSFIACSISTMEQKVAMATTTSRASR